MYGGGGAGVPNGDSKNWDRVCYSIDQFRTRHGRWPKRVRMIPVCFVDLTTHVLTPLGFALVSSVVELVPEEDAEMIADDGTEEGLPVARPSSPSGPAHQWFGQAIFRPGLES
jgi:hypothetical protein